MESKNKKDEVKDLTGSLYNVLKRNKLRKLSLKSWGRGKILMDWDLSSCVTVTS